MTENQDDRLRVISGKTAVLSARRERIVAFAADKRLPAFYFWREYQGLPRGTCNLFDCQQQFAVVRVYQETYGRVWWEQFPNLVKPRERCRQHGYAGGIASGSEAFSRADLHGVGRNDENDGNG